MSAEWIVITGAREHNLRNLTLRIPRNRLTVVTGLSGSGKSSLVFDTLYAEGQRRYVESLSAYARQFLDQLQKPDVESIEGLSPAIAIEQRTASSNPRSIIATATELHDHLRLLFANLGVPHCYKCGRELGRQSAQQIVDRLRALPERTRLILLAPMVREKKGAHKETLQLVRKQGFVRVRVDGAIHELEDVPDLDPQKVHSLDAVIDRLVLTGSIETRLTDSVELAFKHGSGDLAVLYQGAEGGDWVEQRFCEKFACPDCGVSFEELVPRCFSFNSPYGACPRCSGLGTHLVFDEDLVVPNKALSLANGAIQPWRKTSRRMIIYYKSLLRGLAKHYGFELETPYNELSPELRRILLHGSGEEGVERGQWRGGAYRKSSKPFEGVLPNLQRRYETTKGESTRQRLMGYMSRQICPDCNGRRLKPESLSCTIDGRSIADIAALSVRDALQWFDALSLTPFQQQIVGEVLREIRRKLRFLVDVGVDYLTLDRTMASLSGGEAQRIHLATHIGSGLVGVLYVLDEPTIGLHARDNDRLIAMLLALRDLGNTVVVVEHDEHMIRAADYVVDLGPGAGVHGGTVVCAGTVPELLACEASSTAHYLNRQTRIPVPARRVKAGKDVLRIVGASENNLKNLTVSIPLGLLVCVTGVSGSGKSTLVDDILSRALFRHFYRAKDRPGRHKEIRGLEALDKIIAIDQSPIGRTPRSNLATYTGAFTAVRKLFAGTPASKLRGYGPNRYSFNVKGGRCETCKGDGLLCLEMHFLPDVHVVCERCGGARYNRETLQVRYGGKNISEVLHMTVDEAADFFQNVPAIARHLATLSEVGLGYLELGQSATTLSGGEAQRIKLSAELSRKATGRTIYLLDEPTTGLHFADTHRLLQVLLRLRDGGNTVLVIEHNLDVIKTADYVIDLGPGGGAQGGEVVVAGTPEEVARCAQSITGQYLREALG